MEILIGRNKLKCLSGYLKANNIKDLYIITDNIVHDLYMARLKEYLKDFNLNTFILEAGEASKNIENLCYIYDDLLAKNIGRDTLIITFGGGVVGDIGGYAAASYKRGLRYIQVPTSLLAQVDSSVGGKVAIDYGGYKNIIGSFHFPDLVVVNTMYLSSLDEREISCGLGEVFKYGLIHDFKLFEFLEENLEKIYERDLEVLEYIVEKSIAIKDEIVSKDKYDKGLRQTLNFGHTIGHAIEAYYNFKSYNHGEAVILGMIYESYIALELGLIDESYFKEIYGGLENLVEAIKFNQQEIEALIDLMENDKKNVHGKIIFILPKARGKVASYDRIDRGLIRKSLSGKWI